MNHDAVRRRLSAYMEKRLSVRAHVRVEAHLDACPACREELHALDRTVHLIRGLEIEEPPDDLAARVFARIEAGEGRPDGSARLAAWWNAAWTAPLATAVAGLALLLAVQTVEIRVGWPSADPAPVSHPAIARTKAALPEIPSAASGAAPALLAARASAGTNPPAPPAPSGASLRTRCLRQPGSVSCAAWHSWLLGMAVDEPRAFVLEVDAVPPSDRGRWLVDLSRFAAHTGSAPRVAERLRETRDPRAQQLAPHFERVSSR